MQQSTLAAALAATSPLLAMARPRCDLMIDGDTDIGSEGSLDVGADSLMANMSCSRGLRQLLRPHLGWLTEEHFCRIKSAQHALARSHTISVRDERLMSGLNLLRHKDHRRWESAGLERGGALVITTPPRRKHWALWAPPALQVFNATMGAPAHLRPLLQTTNFAFNTALKAGEVGILASNMRAWRHALEMQWDWVAIFEDDASYAHGHMKQLLALLPSLVESASLADPLWRLLVLSRADQEYFRTTLTGQANSLREHVPSEPEVLPPRAGDGSGAAGAWYRTAPTLWAPGWVYSRRTMRELLDAGESAFVPPKLNEASKSPDGETLPPKECIYEEVPSRRLPAFARRCPFKPPSQKLTPLDVWVWEVLVSNGAGRNALSLERPVVCTRQMASVREFLDDPTRARTGQIPGWRGGAGADGVSAAADKALVDVTFRLDMRGVSVSERHPAGPHLAGSFRGWDALKMTLQADGTYSYTEHGVAAHGPIEFKFLNGRRAREDITYGDDGKDSFCMRSIPKDLIDAVGKSILDPGERNRVVEVGGSDMTLPTVCFARCVACDGST